MKIKLLDGTIKEFENELSILGISESIAISLGKQCIGGRINGLINVSSDFVINHDVDLEIITNKSELEKQVSASSAAYALNQIVKREYTIDQTKIIANIDGTFSLILKTDKTFSKDEIEKIEQDLIEFIKNNKIIISKDSISESEFKEYIDKKCIDIDESIEKVSQFLKPVSYTFSEDNSDNFIPLYPIHKDLNTLKKVKLFSSSSYEIAKDESKYQLIRGFATSNVAYFDEFIAQEEEKRKKDHRYIGKQLEIFTIDPLIGQGLPIWLPNGTIIKEEIKNYLKEKEWEYDFIQVQTPVIGTVDLYRTSGHWDHYREDMFAPMELPKEEMVLKPMSCPHHIAIYNNKLRSYRDLPLRLAEHALQYRYESSGSLTGLERVRAMELTDSHIFCRADQIKEEFRRAFKLIQEVLEVFQIKIDYLSFSVRDPEDKEKYFDNDKMWNDAESQLQEVLDDLGVEYKRMVGEAAFYGPKLDIQAKTVLGHEITVSTLQLDFLLPNKFNLKYTNQDGNDSQPIMIHRGLIGTYERFISVLLEQTSGSLPVWLSPRQIVVIPVNLDEHIKYSQEIKDLFKSQKLRSEIDEREERLNYKIREAQVNKIPYTLVIGNEEIKNNTVTYRKYGSQDQTTMHLNEFVKMIKDEIINKK